MTLPSEDTVPPKLPDEVNMSNLLKQSEIIELLVDLGMKEKQAKIGSAIALCESPAGVAADGQHRSNFDAVGDEALANETWGFSYGGFQIRSLRSQKGTKAIRDEEMLVRPRFNCKSAIAIKQAWGSWEAWSTYTSGMYKAYLPDLFPPPPNTYVVLGGDTLTSITEDISDGSWTWEDLARLNGLHSPYIIYISQQLTIPPAP